MNFLELSKTKRWLACSEKIANTGENEAGQQRGEKLESFHFLHAVFLPLGKKIFRKPVQRTQEHTWHCQNPISAWPKLCTCQDIKKRGCETMKREIPSPGVSLGKRCRIFSFPGVLGGDAPDGAPGSIYCVLIMSPWFMKSLLWC